VSGFDQLSKHFWAISKKIDPIIMSEIFNEYSLKRLLRWRRQILRSSDRVWRSRRACCPKLPRLSIRGWGTSRGSSSKERAKLAEGYLVSDPQLRNIKHFIESESEWKWSEFQIEHYIKCKFIGVIYWSYLFELFIGAIYYLLELLELFQNQKDMIFNTWFLC